MLRRALKVAFAECLFRSGILSLERALRKRHTAVVLMYHRVNDDDDPFFPSLPVRVFTEQLDYLRDRYRIEPLDSVIEWVEAGGGGEPRAALTIDDGYPDTHDVVLPELLRRNLTATVFLSTSPLESGRPLWTERLRLALKRERSSRTELDLSSLGLGVVSLGTPAERLAVLRAVLERLKREDADAIETTIEYVERALSPEGSQSAVERIHDGHRVLSWSEVRAMVGSGHVRLGAHTDHHYILSHLDDARLEREIRTSVELIEARSGAPVTTFCYPNGQSEDYDGRSMAVLSRLGIRYAVTATSALVARGTHPYQLPRLYTSERRLSLFAFRLARLNRLDRLDQLDLLEKPSAHPPTSPTSSPPVGAPRRLRRGEGANG